MAAPTDGGVTRGRTSHGWATDGRTPHGRIPAGWAARIARGTPPHRNRAVDALRAMAMVGVVTGHWLVTGLTVDPRGALHQASPLSAMPVFAPLTWVLQTLGLFFFVSGYAATRGLTRALSGGASVRSWLASRVRRILPPIALFVGAWWLLRLALEASRVEPQTLRTISKLMISPLWFVLVLVLLTLVTPVLVRVEASVGTVAALAALAVVAAVDVAQFAAGVAIPRWLAHLSVPAAWLVPYLLGVARAQGRLGDRRLGPAMAAVGAVAGLVLIGWAGYPASMVGVPGDGRSNIAPPSLLAVALALVQIGLALACWTRLSRLLERPRWWAVVVVLNLSAMTVFLWHQSALLGVSAVGRALLGAPLGLVGPPSGSAWLLGRLLWLPAFAGALALLWLLTRRVEHLGRMPGAGRLPRRRARPPLVVAPDP
ncbi:MAG TPA: acyltransferase, partial [Pilimelia sp.]|nr:acyltransferase [Pilimelia sp.]